MASPTLTSSTRKLYGRDEEWLKLFQAYQARQKRHLVLSVGAAGVGKTALVQKLQQTVQKDGGFFVQGRFDDLEHPEPYAPWRSTAEKLLLQMIEAYDETRLAEIIKALQKSMEESEWRALATLIPILGELLEVPKAEASPVQNHPQSKVANGESTSFNARFFVLFGALLRALTTTLDGSTSPPIVWFVDDVHNADSASLEIIKLLLADPRIHNILVVIAFRPVSIQHPTSLFLQTLESAGIDMVPVLPTPLSQSDVLQWLQQHPARDKWNLATNKESILAKQIREGTKGNALSIQLWFMLLSISPRDDNSLKEGESGDATTLFKRVFEGLSPSTRKVCSTAACIGVQIEMPRLAEVQSLPVQIAMEEATAHGIVYLQNEEQIGQPAESNPAANDTSKLGRYAFTTSTFREIIYSLMSSEERKLQHAAIGNAFRKNLIQVGVFRTVVHMNLGGNHLSQKAKDAFVPYCLEAGKLASQWSAFDLADRLFHWGISQVDYKTRWKAENTTRTLELYRQAAEMSIELGRYQTMEVLVDEALEHSKDSTQKIRIALIQVRSLIARARFHEAVAIGCKALQKATNESFKVSPKTIDMELRSTQKLLEGVTEKILIDSPSMVDSKMLRTMEILNVLVAPALVVRGDLVPILACRMVKATVRYGLAPSSPMAFSLLGVVLCSQTGDVTLGTFCSNFSLKLADHMQLTFSKGSVMTLYWGLYSLHVQPWHACQEPLKIAYRACVKAGDNEFALISPLISVLNMFAAGGPLPPIIEAMKSVHHLLIRKEQESLDRIFRPFYQLVLNLSGVSPEMNPTVLTGNVMNQDDDLRYIKENPEASKAMECCLLWCQAMVTFHMHQFETARGLILDCMQTLQKHPQPLLASMQPSLEFWNAMTAVRLLWRLRMLAKSTGNPTLTVEQKRSMQALQGQISDSLKKMKVWAKGVPRSFKHKEVLLQAEQLALDGKVQSAITTFQQAIDMARENGSCGDQAIFGEQAGVTLRYCGEDDQALDYLEDCCASYRDWGSPIKVNHVKGSVIPETVGDSD